jgi:hypothetical protein
MTINGLKLPDAFVALIDRPEPVYWWVPKSGNTAWIYKGGEGGVYWVPEGTPGRHEWLDDLMLCKSQAKIEEATVLLPNSFHIDEYTAEDIAQWGAEWSNQPGFIPYITDFSQIVHFGEAGDAADYCFDYRDNPGDPSIIHWNDAYWRRMAPNFDTFISWFEPLGDGQ